MPKTSVAILMDPLENIHIDKDTTFALSLEAQRRGFELVVFFMRDLWIDQTLCGGYGRRVEFMRDSPCWHWIEDKQPYNFDDFDFVLIRKDPPFDEAYFFATHFLSLCKKAKVVNRPLGLRQAPEKLYSLNFPSVMPESLISANVDQIEAFMEKVGGKIIIKPLNRCGGSGIIFLEKGDRNFYSLVELSTKEGQEPIQVQRYLPEIRQGDKRVICIHGKPVGAIMRTPDDKDHRGNIHVGGQVAFSELSKRDQWLIDQISEGLVEDGLYFTGIDIIGNFITEINVTSPTGIQEIQQLGGIDVAKIFWDEMHHFKG